MDDTEAANKTHTIASLVESHEPVLSDNYNGNSGIVQAMVTPMETISCAIESDTPNRNSIEASKTSMPAPVMDLFLGKDQKQETEKTSTSTSIGPCTTKPAEDNSLLISNSIISYQRRKNKKNTGMTNI